MYDIDLTQLKKFIRASSYEYDDIMIKNNNDPEVLRKEFSSIRYYNNVTVVDDNYNKKLKKIISDNLELSENMLVFQYDVTGDSNYDNGCYYCDSWYSYAIVYLDENKLKLLQFSILEEEEKKNKLAKTTYKCYHDQDSSINLEYIIRRCDNIIEIIAYHFGYDVLLNSL